MLYARGTGTTNCSEDNGRSSLAKRWLQTSRMDRGVAVSLAGRHTICKAESVRLMYSIMSILCSTMRHCCYGVLARLCSPSAMLQFMSSLKPAPHLHLECLPHRHIPPRRADIHRILPTVPERIATRIRYSTSKRQPQRIRQMTLTKLTQTLLLAIDQLVPAPPLPVLC